MYSERIDLFIIFQTVLYCFVLWRNRLSVCVITDQFQELTSYRRKGTLAVNGRFLARLILQQFWHFYWPYARDVFSAMSISTALLLDKHNYIISSNLVRADIPAQCCFMLDSCSLLAWRNAASFYHTLQFSDDSEIYYLCETVIRIKACRAGWMYTKRKESPVCKALKNTTEEKWNCNIWINNDPSYAPLYKHMHKDIHTHTWKAFQNNFTEIFLTTR